MFLAGAVLFESLTGWMSIIHNDQTGEQDRFQATQHAAATAGSLKDVLNTQASVLKQLR
jgi:hypothetical protein